MASYLTLLSPPCCLTRFPSLALAPYTSSSAVRRLRCPAARQTVVPSPLRRSGNYPPSWWDDCYIQSLRSDFTEEHAVQIEKLKQKVRRLIEEEKEMVEQLELVDALQQLGVAYHFEEEIMDVLGNISRSVLEDKTMLIEQDLYANALLFRLLREHGFNASQDVFNRFKDEAGSFKVCLCHDPKGLLSLYQASYLAMEGENTMDEARDFTTKHLKDLKGDSLDACLREHVAHALELPLNWRMQRLHTRWFVEIYEREENRNHVLVELAKLDFNMVQSIYKIELKELSRWWADLDLLGDKLSFVRNRLVENYYWTVGTAFEPKFWRYREEMTKAACFITMIDDVYDVYGSLDELELFTDAVERWEVSAMEQLPEYMKICLLALFNTTNDTSYKILKDKGVDIIPYLKRAWTDLCKTYLVEARWYHKGYTPTLEEYLENAWISISGNVLLTLVYCVNEHVTMEALDSFKSYPDILCWSSMILRLCNDLATSTAELKRGDSPKCIQCFMHERGVSEDIAREHIRDLISVYWKKLNGDRFASSPFERFFKTTAINLPRMTQCIYQHGDGYGVEPDRETKDRVISLFVEPILL